MKKKLTGMVFIAFMAMGASGQNMTVNTGRTTFGIRAGVNFQNINGKQATGQELENKLKRGFHAGVNAEIPIGPGFYIQPGLLYSMKGAKYYSGSKLSLNYIEVPVNLVYKPILGTGNMVLGFGPYVALGVGGKYEDPNGNSVDVVYNKKVDYTVAAAQVRPLDAGGNFLAGYEFANKFSVQLNAQLGLVDINPETEFSPPGGDETRWRNTGWGLSLGYRF